MTCVISHQVHGQALTGKLVIFLQSSHSRVYFKGHRGPAQATAGGLWVEPSHPPSCPFPSKAITCWRRRQAQAVAMETAAGAGEGGGWGPHRHRDWNFPGSDVRVCVWWWWWGCLKCQASILYVHNKCLSKEMNDLPLLSPQMPGESCLPSAG